MLAALFRALVFDASFVQVSTRERSLLAGVSRTGGRRLLTGHPGTGVVDVATERRAGYLPRVAIEDRMADLRSNRRRSLIVDLIEDCGVFRIREDHLENHRHRSSGYLRMRPRRRFAGRDHRLVCTLDKTHLLVGGPCP